MSNDAARLSMMAAAFEKAGVDPAFVDGFRSAAPTSKKWAAEWTAAGGWLVYLGTEDGKFHDAKLPPEREADAKLAAAAKALYDALDDVLSAWGSKSGMGTVYEMERALPNARAALTKARG